MTERKLKPLFQILNENEIKNFNLTRKGNITYIVFKEGTHLDLKEWPNCGPFPDNFYEEEEYLELKSLDELRAEFAHKDSNGSVFFQEEDMLILNPGMVKGWANATLGVRQGL